jgi:hypothetical protein
MSSSPKVSATSSNAAISVPTRVVSDARLASYDRAENVSPTTQVDFSGYWRSRYDDTVSQDGSGSFGNGQNRSQPQFTPLVASRAAAFPANQIFSDSLPTATLFGSDLQRALGIYEFNMKLFAGGYDLQGSVINRYS